MSNQPLSNQNITTQPIVSIDPTPLLKSDSSTAVILSVAIFSSVLLASVTTLVQVIIKGKDSR
jgi:hypothetical protein